MQSLMNACRTEIVSPVTKCYTWLTTGCVGVSVGSGVGRGVHVNTCIIHTHGGSGGQKCALQIDGWRVSGFASRHSMTLVL